MDNESSFSDTRPKIPAQPASAANGSASGVKRELNDLAADIGDLVTATKTLAGDDLTRAKARLDAGVESAKVTVGKAGDELANRARNTARVGDTYVHQQPWKAIGIGAALGLVLGFMLGARRS